MLIGSLSRGDGPVPNFPLAGFRRGEFDACLRPRMRVPIDIEQPRGIDRGVDLR